MKKILFIVLIAMAMGATTSADTCVRVIKCEVCDKEIRETYNCSGLFVWDGGDDFVITLDDSTWYHSHKNNVPMCELFNWHAEVKLCPYCFKKYTNDWKLLLRSLTMPSNRQVINYAP